MVAVSRDASKLEKLKVLISPSRTENLLMIEGDIGETFGYLLPHITSFHNVSLNPNMTDNHDSQTSH